MVKKAVRKQKSALIIPLIIKTVCIIGVVIPAFFWWRRTHTPFVIMRSINEETMLYKITGEYPVFTENLDELNARVEKDISNRVQEFKTQSDENWEDTKKFHTSDGVVPEFPNAPFTFTLQYAPQQINRNFVSFVINMEWFTGGANMAQDYATYNWDVQNNKPVSLKDLFIEDTYLSDVSKYVKATLFDQFQASGIEEQYISKDMLDAGTAPIIENFLRFTFDDGSITFYFPKYQVAPGASGPQKVKMPRVSR